MEEELDQKYNPFLTRPHKGSNIKNIIAVISGKGGVGKSLVTSLLATSLQRSGNLVGILDADITGPTIPSTFGMFDRATGDQDGLDPVLTRTNIKIMSTNLMLDDPSQPVIWRAPMVNGAIKQFYSEVRWGDVDYMLIDCPPGTGDVLLTIFQSLPIKGIIVVTSPQELVSLIVKKAANMAKMMNVPILGIVENMSYFECDNCHTKHYIYGESHVDEVAKEFGIKHVCKLPMNPNFAKLCDDGEIEKYDNKEINKFIKDITEEIK